MPWGLWRRLWGLECRAFDFQFYTLPQSTGWSEGCGFLSDCELFDYFLGGAADFFPFFERFLEFGSFCILYRILLRH